MTTIIAGSVVIVVTILMNDMSDASGMIDINGMGDVNLFNRSESIEFSQSIYGRSVTLADARSFGQSLGRLI